ncbi:MAG: ABC transporter permease subunit [Spirochaetales bacterium]|nr:ABC transporter permease subunit [Spirochaetales bacterium]
MRMWARKLKQISAVVLMIAAVGVFFLIFAAIVIAILVKGLPGLSLDLVTKLPESGLYLGGGGGVLNAIVGSLLVGFGATVLALSVSLPLVLFINLYLRRGARLAEAVRFSLDVLWGVPSIVYGACGVAVMLAVGMRGSLLAAVVVVALIEVPILSRAFDEVVRLVPRELDEAVLSLGASLRTLAFRVVLRAVLPGLVTAALLAFGRGIGDAAAVMLVAGYQDGIPANPLEPVATLPLAIFFLVSTPGAQARGYAAGMVLVLLIVFFSLFSRYVGKRLSSHRIGD